MSDYLCIAVTFIDSRFHGRGDGDDPEWPPSPLRLMQAIVAGNSDGIDEGSDLDLALQWLESQEPPYIVAPPYEVCVPYYLSVPNNVMDIVGKAWSRGKYFGSGDTNPATHRTMKPVRPVRMTRGDTVFYLWTLSGSRQELARVGPLISAARRIVALGWGIDLVVSRAAFIRTDDFRELRGERWLPSISTNVAALRAPVPGTLDGLRERHDAFLGRIVGGTFAPVAPLSRFKVTGYRRSSDPVTRPYAVFELRHEDGSFCRYPQRKLMHIAGMVRHLAKKAMVTSPPPDVDEDWVERYVVGHRDESKEEHRQLSYIPLPSIGHQYADRSVRRVMVAGPVGDDAWLEHLVQRLAGRTLEPENGDEFGEPGPPTLIRVYRDAVANHYTAPANRWASVMPVILPGYDDRKPTKTRKLIRTALTQSGIDQQCTYEWSAFSRFPNSLSAHKYDRNKKPIYLKPRYLQQFTAVHLTLTFREDLRVAGPLIVGAGRHIGFGAMARMET